MIIVAAVILSFPLWGIAFELNNLNKKGGEK
jgi:hypothetical protein